MLYLRSDIESYEEQPMKTHHTNQQVLLLTLFMVVAAFATTGCEKGLFSLNMDGEEVEFAKPGVETKEDDPTTPEVEGEVEGCIPNDRFFLREVWAPAVSNNCAACHNQQGSAKDSEFVLYNSGWGNYLEANFRVMSDLAKTSRDGESILILKALGRVSHGGGAVMQDGDATHQRLKAFVNRVEQGAACESANDAEFYQDVTLLDQQQVLRKSTLSLAGRLPTQAEYDAVESQGLEAVLDQVMSEDGFYTRMTESFNDLFLTDMYLPGDDAVELLDEDIFPDRMWYEDIGDDDQRRAARDATNDAIARESLQLIRHVISQDRPFTEILTADYTLVTPFSARAYGIMDSVSFNDENDENEWVEAQIPGQPHAGVLSTATFLNRYPTTDTNRNRHRSTIFYKYFLATDVLKLAERPIDPTESDLSNNPTLFDAQCTVCHEVVDPVAGAFQNWNDDGMYDPMDNWYTDMLPPGIEDDKISQTDAPESVRWLASETVTDPRFVQSAVEHAYKILTGDEPLTFPNDPTRASYEAEFHAYEVQYEFFKQIGKTFVESNYNFKVLLKEVIKSPYYRADEVDSNITPERQLELKSIGTARLLSPEQLHRKIEAVTGTEWRVNNRSVLLDTREFNLLYGGIDSRSITQRMTAPNALASSIARRMSNEVSCLATARDFGREEGERVLFPHVTLEDTPDSNSAAIRENVKYLHWQILGQKLEDGDPEIERTYNLFNDIYQDYRDGEYGDGLPNMCEANGVDDDPNRTVRSWMAVVSYMLSTYDFLYE